MLRAAGPKPAVQPYDITGHLAKLSADHRVWVPLSRNRKPSRPIIAQADGSFAFHTVAVTDRDHAKGDFTAHPRTGTNAH